MDAETRIQIYRGWVATLACAIYNGEEDWDKQTVASFLHMGDPSIDYTFRGTPPETITEEDVFVALDRIFERHDE